MITEKFACDGEAYRIVVDEVFLNNQNVKIYKANETKTHEALLKATPIASFDLDNIAYQLTMSQLRLETVIEDFEKSKKAKDRSIRKEFYKIIGQIHPKQDLYIREQLIKIAEGEFKEYPSSWIPDKYTYLDLGREYESLSTLGRTHYFMIDLLDEMICCYCGERLRYGSLVMRQAIDVMSEHLYNEHESLSNG